MEPTAKAYGLFVAIPDVGDANDYGQGCWDFRDAADLHHNIRDIVDLAAALKSRILDIDPNQVYVTGLSSGAAIALQTACKAPDVFAGVGAVEGPSVGSNQNNSVRPGGAVCQWRKVPPSELSVALVADTNPREG